MNQSQRRQDDAGNWQYRADDGYWYDESDPEDLEDEDEDYEAR